MKKFLVTIAVMAMAVPAFAQSAAPARFAVVDLTSHEPTLEDIFLTFYGPEAVAAT